MGELGQQTVDFSMLVARAAEKSYLALKELVENSRGFDLSDSEKKIGILKYIVKTQQRMLRLNVLAKWCQQVPLIQYTRQLGSTLSSHDTCFSQAADSLFFMHESLQLARAPIYDVPSAIEVLLTGNYQRLPKCIEEVGVQSTLTKDQQTPALKKLDTLVRSKLLEVSIPKDITEIKVSDGTALLRVNGEFKVLVTLGYRGNMSLWRILHLELLVGERGKPVLLEESRRHALGDDIERRMAATDHPFMILYSVLHELCVGLVMDTVIWQVQALRRGRWKDAIRFELISDGSVGLGGNTGSTQSAQEGDTDAAGLKTPGLKILYWLDFDKSPSNPDRRSCPFIKIEPGQDLRIKCIHSTFVIDPVTGKEAEISIDQSSIDVEKLLLHAICCNRYTRLLEVFKDLEKNGQINQASGDLDLKLQTAEVDSNCGKEYTFDDVKYVGLLMVRAYGSSFFSLGINIRNGLFLLRSSKNVLSPSEVAECEESLNLRSITAAEAFISLRRKSILHLFACFARFLGLEVFEHGFATLKVPMSISNGLSMLLMAFPDCGGSYYLLMQLDKDFRPLFKLLETQADPSGDAAHSFTDPSDVVCLKTVDIVQMQICEDDLNLSLHDCGKLLSSLPRNDINQSSEEFVLEGSALNSNIRSNFSSIVDEVFELEKGSSVPSFSVLAPPSTFGASPVSQLGAGVVDHQNSNVGILSPNCERGVETNSASRAYNMLSNFNMSVYGAGNYNGLLQSGSPCSTSSRHGPYNIVGEHQLTATGVPAIRHMSSPQSGAPAFGSSGPRDGGVVSGNPRVPVYNSLVASSAASYPDSTVHVNSSMDTNVRQDKISKKRTVSELFNALPSLQYLELNGGSQKRKKITRKNNQQLSFSMLMISEFTRKAGRFCYADLIAEANKGNAPSGIYVSALFHVFRHCSLAIKQARLTSQMEALDIPYVEEVGLRSASSSLWFVIPFARGNTWQHMCLRLGRPGSMYWDVKICDQHFRDLWELQKGIRETPWGSGVRIADTSDLDSHVHYDSEGVVLSYYSVEADSIKKLVSDIQRLSNARTFAQGMRKLLGVRADGKFEEGITSSDQKPPGGAKVVPETVDKFSEQVRRAFKIEAVGFLSLWFSFGPGVLARFVVEWESSKDGCTIHVSPDQLWPHTKFLEDFINGGEVVSLLDCIRLTAGPLHALAAATRPARASPIPLSPITILPSVSIQSGYITTNPNINANHSSSGPGAGGSTSAGSGTHSAQNHLTTAMMAVAAAAAAGRGVSGIVPTPLLPIDVSVVLRGPYWIRIIYRKDFAVDMRCYAGDQVWLQPATPPKGGPSAGGSLPCPQFRPFIMEHVAQELNGLDIGFTGGQQIGLTNVNSTSTQFSAANVSRNLSNTSGMSRTTNPAAVNRVVNAIQPTSNFVAVNSGMPIRRSHGSGVPALVRGELNTAIIGLGDDGGYGGGWVPLVALKKVLRGTLKYLGVLWLFGQLPDLLKEILGSILKDNEGALLNLDQEQPALRFFVGGYVFAVSVHRVQLLLQVISIKRFHQAQQQQNNSAPTAHEELSPSEIGEICDYFSRRVASEPYDVSRVASFITLLTLPIPVLREFLKLIAWKKGLLLLLLAQQSQSGVGDGSPPQKARIEFCLEDHEGKTETLSTSKSNIHYNRSHNAVDFGLSVALDPTHIPHLNPAGGAAWLPYCVSVRLRYSFGENCVSFLGMEGSHGGRACWIRVDDWEKCKQRVARTVEMNSGGDVNLGRLRVVADNVQRTLHSCLQGLKDEGIGTT